MHLSEEKFSSHLMDIIRLVIYVLELLTIMAPLISPHFVQSS